MATIVSENAKQIRDPMQVLVTMRVDSDVRITNITPGPDYKSYDATLLDPAYEMRILADLQDGGFVLDGSAEWYEDKTPSAENGKLGLRGTANESVSITLTGNKALGSMTIKTQQCARIEWEGRSILATGLDYVNTTRTTTTITFYPAEENGRVLVEYIEPGLTLDINNENLIRADVVLRSNLDPFATTLEESEINVDMWYPNDLSDVFKYIGDDWPITYQAGYTNEKSPIRKFYLDGQVTWKNSVLSFRGVDAVSKLEVTIPEGDGALANYYIPGVESIWMFSIQGLSSSVSKAILKAGVAHDRFGKSDYDAPQPTSYVIKPEMTLRDYLQRLMSYTAYLDSHSRFAYVDAGIPRWYVDEAHTSTWTLQEEDLGDVTFKKVRNVSQIHTQGSGTLVEVSLTDGQKIFNQQIEVEKNGIFDLSAEGAYLRFGVQNSNASVIQWAPSTATYKSKITGTLWMKYYICIETGGVHTMTNPNGRPGEKVQIEPFCTGRLFNSHGQDLFSPRNLFAGVRDKISFTFKGDPRWQPRDFLTINRLDGTQTKTRVGSIHITHEGGGTLAEVEAAYTDLY